MSPKSSFHHRGTEAQRLFAVLCASVPLWLIPNLALSKQLDPKGRGSNPVLVSQIDTLLAEPGLKGGFQGLVIESLKDGSTWYERNPDLMFIPASNEKLLTSSAVLNALGPDWRYVTRLLRSGEVASDGTLRGDLIIKGSGDPLLEAKELDALVDSVKAAGIKRIDGRVVGDESRFDTVRYGDGWAWDDMPFYYSAQVSALNLNENMVQIRTEPGTRPGDRIRVRISPIDKYVKINNTATTAPKGTKSALSVTRDIGVNRITVSGSLALDAKPDDHKPVDVTIEDPALYTAAVLAERLRAAGVRNDGPKVVAAPPNCVEIARHESPPMSEILKRLNKPSDNLVAECLLKTLGAEKGRAGTWAEGRRVAMEWFTSIGMDPNGFDMTDGSGLSRQTFVTPRNLAKLLKTMYNHPDSKVFIDSLPIAGVDGTLRNRMKGTPAEGNCRAKSGYVSSCSSLSGYVTTADGEPLLFVTLMNNHKARNAVPMGVQNRIVELLASWKRAH